MAKKMLIDSTHPEETRVVVVNGNKVEEFDFDSTSRSLITGNIYLAKVSRVEPSLQAAFVDYGGNRQGFLAFSEIHPDYYQIPQADREALIQEELARQAEEAEEEENEGDALAEAQESKQGKSRRSRSRRRSPKSKTLAENSAEDKVQSDIIEDDGEAGIEGLNEPAGEAAASDIPAKSENEGDEDAIQAEAPKSRKTRRSRKKSSESTDEATEAMVDDKQSVLEDAELDAQNAGDDVIKEDDGDNLDASESMLADPREEAEEVETDIDDVEEDIRPKATKRRSARPYNRYKIQEVIKPRQIILVQVIKEERGNKGAALTTYLSLPGRYCVLMPNTARGGGISRKISNIQDRKRLRNLAKSFKVPQGAGLIVRTAGAKRDAQEIERDYAFLTRQWNQIRELTLSSTAPAAIYEESGPIKRAIRDLLNPEIDEILIEGERGYQEARDYMNVLMPERINSVKLYNQKMPLFNRYQVENYLSSMFNPVVQLKSGGYLVIGVTEALVAIDVNSGRSTKEASIEETALKTNLEAAEEVARQLKLRDLAGLIVIDFIDMEQHRHQQEVENKLKDCLRKDRARIQVGRISSFGLLEMSRQRLRTGLVEAITTPCPHCQGTGILRSDESLALSVIRAIEEEISRGRANEIDVFVAPSIANYLFNEKRDYLFGLLDQYGVLVRISADPELHSGEHKIERIKNPSRPLPKSTPVSATSLIEQTQTETSEDEKANGNGKKRRRRGGRGRKNNTNGEANSAALEGNEAANENASAGAESLNGDGSEEPRKKPARRSKKKAEAQEDVPALSEENPVADEASPEKPKRKRRSKAEMDAEKSAADRTEAEASPEKPKRKRRTKAEMDAEKSLKDEAAPSEEKPKRKRRTKAEIEAEKTAAEDVSKDDAPKTELASAKATSAPTPTRVANDAEDATPKKKRTGWWSA